MGSDGSTSYLESPTGVRIASFFVPWGEDMPNIEPLIDGLDCGRDHASVEQAIRHIVDQYELMTTTGWERFSKRVYGFLTKEWVLQSSWSQRSWVPSPRLSQQSRPS